MTAKMTAKMTTKMTAKLSVKAAADCRFDSVSLGEVVATKNDRICVDQRH